MNTIMNTGGNNAAGLISLRKFRADLNVVPSTAWRWIQRGWIDQPINIGGRQYLTTEMIRRFKERAIRGEFASAIKPPRKK
jgi:predicted site-specific integrase-resolvase